MKSKLEEAIRLAVNSHMGQFDKGGNLCILHPLTLLQCEISAGYDDEIQQIAVLHDVVEDSDVTFRDLESVFTSRVVEGVRALTKVKGQTYKEYQQAVMSNLDAVKVKMLDLLHNSDLRRLNDVSKKDVLRAQKYHEFYMTLKGVLDANTAGA